MSSLEEYLENFVNQCYGVTKSPKIETIQTLLNKGANPNYKKENSSPLYNAVYLYINQDGTAMYPIIELLLKHKANPNTEVLGSPLLIYILNSPMLGQGQSWTPLISLFLQYGADPNKIATSHLLMRTPLMVVADKKRPIEIAKLLFDYGANPFLRDANGKIFLDIAKANNYKGLVDLYLERFGIDEKDIKSHRQAVFKVPGGRIERAFRATMDSFPTDIKKKQALCKELDSEMYRDELYALAHELNLDVTTQTTKKELCRLLAEFGSQLTRDITDIPSSDVESEESDLNW